MSDTDVLLSHHDLGLVFLLIAIAIVACYTALSFGGFTVAVGQIRKFRLSGGAIAMGIGIWTRYVIAIPTDNLPVAIDCDLPKVFLLLGVAIAVSSMALFKVVRDIFCAGNYAHCSINDRPRVILLDLKLPKVDNLEVLRKINFDPRTRLIPIVVLTSSREERDIVDSYQLRVNTYTVKPVDFEPFAEVGRQLGFGGY